MLAPMGADWNAIGKRRKRRCFHLWFHLAGAWIGPRLQSSHALRNAIAPYLLRRTKRQVDIQFPELRHDVHWLDLSPGQRNAYRDAEYAGVNELRELGLNVTRIHIFSLITSLKLICNYDVTSGQSRKLDFLEDSLDEISANGEKALVSSQYPHMSLSKIADHLKRSIR